MWREGKGKEGEEGGDGGGGGGGGEGGGHLDRGGVGVEGRRQGREGGRVEKPDAAEQEVAAFRGDAREVGIAHEGEMKLCAVAIPAENDVAPEQPQFVNLLFEPGEGAGRRRIGVAGGVGRFVTMQHGASCGPSWSCGVLCRGRAGDSRRTV